MIRHRSFALSLFAALIISVAGGATAQTEKYDVQQVRIYIFDKSGHPWNDASAFLGVRLDAAKKDTLEDQEISAGTISYSVGEEYKRYTLRLDPNGDCIADVSFIVYKTGDKPINYEMTLLKKEGEKYIAVPLTSRTISVTRSTRDRINVNASIFRPMLINDWLLYGGIVLASMLFIYFAIFRWLFSVLLFNNNWPVSRAEYFTTSLGLLLLLAIFGLLLVLALPQTVVMWTILCVLAVFWVGHAITWVLS